MHSARRPNLGLLCSLAERHGYARSQFASPLASLDGSDPSALDGARQALRSTAAAAVRAWVRLALRYNLPLITVLRNLVALASREDLAVYRVLLDMPELARMDPAVRTGIPAMRTQMGPVPADFRLVHTLLHTSRQPRRQEFWDFFTDPIQAFWCSVAYAAPSRESTLRREISRAARHAEPARVLPLLLRLHQEGKLAALTRAEFNRLPPPLRRTILASAPARLALLDPRFTAALESNPRAHPDTAESLRHAALAPVRNAVRAVRRWEFTNPSLREVVQSPQAEEFLPLLWEEIKRIRPIPPGVPRPPAEFLDRVVGVDPEFRGAILFLARPPATRIAALRGDFWARHGAMRVPPREWVETLQATDDRNLVREAIRYMESGQRAEVLERVMKSATPGAGWADDVVREWFDIAPDEVVAALPGNPRWVRRLSEFDPNPRSMTEPLMAALPGLAALGGAAQIVDWLTPERLREAAGLRQERHWKVVELIRGLLPQLARSPRKQLLTTLVRAVLSSDRGLRLLADSAKVTGDSAADQRILDAIFRAVPILPPESPESAHISSLVERWTPVWQERLRTDRSQARVPLASLIAAILTAGGSALDLAFRTHPEPVVRALLRHRPLEDTLRTAFEDPLFAAWVERLTRPQQRLEMIPWVRTEWEATPAVALAYELALASSLPDARYLIGLAKRAAQRGDDQPPGQVFDRLYKTYALPKRSGGSRTITAPDPQLKRLQRRILDNAISPVPLHAAANGFRAGTSVLTNALPHVEKQMVVNLDIASFFPSTRHELIVRACWKVAGGKLSPGAVMLLADICSYRGALPTGAPTSPALANIVLTPVDQALARAAARFGIAYTRYADDLTFSGGGDTHRIIPFVRKVLDELGFAVEEKKVNLFRKGRRQMVTGLVVNAKPNLPRRVRRRLRAAVHHRVTGQAVHWHGRPMRDAELIGHLAVLNLVQPEEARQHREAVKEASKAEQAND